MTRRLLLFLTAVTFCLAVVPQGAFAAEVAPVRIALVTDTHTTRGTLEDQPLYKGHLAQVIAAVNAAHVDFVLVAGDLTQGGKPEEMSDFAAQIKGFQATTLVVAGNHDVGGKHIPGQEGGMTAERAARYEQSFGPSFWTRTLDGVRVIGLNASLFGSGLPREAAQWQFLEAALSPAQHQPTLLLMHYPLYLDKPDEPGGAYWNVEPAPRARLLALIKKNGHVLTVLTGHLHRPLVNKTPEGVLLYTSPPVSFGLPRGKQPEGWTLVTVMPKTGVVHTEFRAIPHLEAPTVPPASGPPTK